MAKPKAIPDGYTTVTPMLNVNGAADAIAFYGNAFGAKELFRMPGPGGAIMHAEIQIGNARVMLSDAMMNDPTHSAIHLYFEDSNAAWKRAVDAGCSVVMPIADMFWGDRFGVVVDQWGNRWSIAEHIEDVPPDEMPKRMEKAMRDVAAGQPPHADETAGKK